MPSDQFGVLRVFCRSSCGTLLVELIEHRLVKALTDPISLGTPGLGAGVVDVFHRLGRDLGQ
jgi:hypothetical protein